MAEATITLKIDDEFKDLLRPLNTEEYESLEESIKTLGMAYDPIIHWGGTIIDGHHRYGICQHGGYEYTTLELDFDSREEAVDWIIDKQYGRRILTPNEIKYYRGYKFNKLEGSTNIEKSKGLQELVKEQGVTDRTLRRDGEYQRNVSNLDPESKNKILKNEIKITSKEIKEIAKMDKVSAEKAIKSIEEGSGIEYEDIDSWVVELAEPYKNSVRQLRGIRKKMEALSFNPTEGKYVAAKYTRLKNNLDELIDIIHQCEPITGCDDCGGEGCNSCYGTGFLSRAAKESQDK